MQRRIAVAVAVTWAPPFARWAGDANSASLIAQFNPDRLVFCAALLVALDPSDKEVELLVKIRS